jgi:hypothetical protein
MSDLPSESQFIQTGDFPSNSEAGTEKNAVGVIPRLGFWISQVLLSQRIRTVEPVEKTEDNVKTENSTADVQFLLAEYDRLKGLEVSHWEIYYARFNSFMTVALGVMAVYATLVTANPPIVSTAFPVPDLLAAVILLWGGFTFLGLVEINYGIKHLANAMIDIQAYFTENHAHLKKRLYFHKQELYEVPSKIEYYASRWILGGSPKLILAVLDSGLSAVLVARFLLWLQSSVVITILCTAAVFVIIGLLHMVYVRFAFRREYLTPGLPEKR